MEARNNSEPADEDISASRTAGSSSGYISPQRKKRRLCYYNEEWRKEFTWLESVPGNSSKARCKLCAATFSIAYDGKNAVSAHEDTKKHKEFHAAVASSQRLKAFFTTPNTVVTDKVTIAEVVEVYHGVRHHISYNAQDCSIKVLKCVIDDSEIVKKMSCGRTKASAIVNNVLQPFALEVVLDKLRTGLPFSVATDASNKGNRKLFPVGVRFFTPSDGITSAIIDFYEDPFEDSRSVKQHLCHVLEGHKLSWKSVSSYAADNASVNYGVNNSVYQKLIAEENPEIIAAHCNDHILHNCAKNALKLLSFDVENLVLKISSEFSNSAMRRQELKDCFEFYESEFREVIRHVPTRWLSLFSALDRILLSWMPLKTYFLSREEEECPAYVWTFLKDQESKVAPMDLPTVTELYMYFVHFFMASFQETILKLEGKYATACDLFDIMDQFRKSLINKADDNFFGMNVKMAIRKNYLSQPEVDKLTREALTVYRRAIDYLQNWFKFDKSPYRHFSALSIHSASKPLTLDDILDIWMQTPLKENAPPDSLHDEVKALEEVYESVRAAGSTADAWCEFFQKESAPNLLKLLQYVLSIPVSNAAVERIFSVMANLWSDERNRLTVEAVRSELMIFFNSTYSCQEFKDIVSRNKQLIKAAQSDAKYHK